MKVFETYFANYANLTVVADGDYMKLILENPNDFYEYRDFSTDLKVEDIDLLIDFFTNVKNNLK